MISRRFAALALGLLAFAGCHQDPTVVQVTVSAAADAFTMTAEGGATSVPAGIVATAGAGAAVQMSSTGPINLGSAATIPSAPALPVPPSTGTELTTGLIGTTVTGTILVSSTLQISGAANPAVITTNTGDVVIYGTLIADRGGASTTNGITINAPAGTIYVFGRIQAPGTAGTPNNPNGGTVMLNALRIVVTGSIDTSGETQSGFGGGNGGAVTLDTTAAGGGSILFTGGSIVTSGGNGTTSGGTAGAVTLKAGNQLAVYAPILANGGTANDVGPSPQGGTGGAVTLEASGGVDVVATIQMMGGNSTGNVDGALGGTGGAFTADSAVPYRIYGAIQTTGGSATATAVGVGAITGGSAGAISIGPGPRVASLEMGNGVYSTRGGQGGGGGGTAGSFAIASIDGDIAVRSSLIARGGDAAGPGNGNGGDGGTISIMTDANVAGNLTNHALSIPSFETLLDTSGGTPIGATGGAGKAVTLQSGGDLTFGGRIISSGGSDGISSIGGSAGAVQLLLDAANTTPSGDLLVSGSITAEGGAPTTAAGGNGNTIDIKTVKAGSLGSVTCSATLSTAGGGNGGGGNAGAITITALIGDVSLSGSISASGRSAATAPGSAANVAVSAGGSISSSALISTSGGSGTDSTAVINGANAANVSFASTTIRGAITLLGGTSINANGGNATSTGIGGTGGRVLMTTLDQAVTITGVILAQGGASSGSGGLGGQVVVDSDSNNSGPGGPITLTTGSVINVSGGAGTIGGFTRNNGGVAPADSTGTSTLCVIFDAAGSLAASPDGGGEGVVQNLGTIIATGGSATARGGDVWFDGKNALGAALTGTDGGAQTLTGPAGNGAFFPN